MNDLTLKDKLDYFKETHNEPDIAVMLLMSRELQKLCFKLSVKSGWWDELNPHDPYVFATKLALVHSEVSEALEGGRKGLRDGHLPHRLAEEVELADAIIRIFDLAGARDLDVAGAIIEKLHYNQYRGDHKIDKRAAEGGKKF